MNAIFFVIKRGNMSNIEIMKLEDVVSVLNGIKLENIVFGLEQVLIAMDVLDCL